MKRLLPVIIAIAILNSPANAQMVDMLRAASASSIIQACKEAPTQPQERIGNCWGQIQALYILAHIDGLAADKRFCPPDGVSISDAKQIVIKYIDARGPFDYVPFMFVAIEALRRSWPCR